MKNFLAIGMIFLFSFLLVAYDGQIEKVPYDQSIQKIVWNVQINFPGFTMEDFAVLNGGLIFYQGDSVKIPILKKEKDVSLMLGANIRAINLIKESRAKDYPFVSAEIYVGPQWKVFGIFVAAQVAQNKGLLNYFDDRALWGGALGCNLKYSDSNHRFSVYTLGVPDDNGRRHAPTVAFQVESGLKFDSWVTDFYGYVELNERHKLTGTLDVVYIPLSTDKWKVGVGSFAQYTSLDRNHVKTEKVSEELTYMEAVIGLQLYCSFDDFFEIKGQIGRGNEKNTTVGMTVRIRR